MRGRPALLLGGALLAVLAVLLAPPPPAGGGLLHALGRSMGGLRVVLEDALFLRAEALRQDRRRVEELPALYEAILELDPDNTAAVDYLAWTYAYVLLPEAPDAEARFGWWREAWDMLGRALERHPRSPALLQRAADLLLDVARRSPGLRARVEDLVGDAEMLGLQRLVAVARLTDDVPRRGREHLLRLALEVPTKAAGRIRDGRPGADEVLAIGDEVLERRGETLADMLFPLEEGVLPGVRALPVDLVLREGLRAVRRVRDLPPAEASEALEDYRRRVPSTPVEEVLAQILSRRRG